MGRERLLIGHIGERKAVEFLRRKGYKILALNYRTVFGEIDAIARKKDFIIFVEIKTRASSSLGPPYISVTGLKKLHIIRSALSYLKRYDMVDCNWRIDVVSVRLDFSGEVKDIEIIENAVEEE